MSGDRDDATNPPARHPLRSLGRALLLVCGFLLIPILPLVVLGSAFESQVTAWLQAELTPTERFWLLAGVLATDIFLPIPSSAVSTYGGGLLGTFPAALASWLGMNAGAALGFALSRRFGQPFAVWLTGAEELRRIEGFCQAHGPLALILFRGLPLLAEASVLLMGTAGLTWKRFLVPVLISNLLISLVYAAFGEFLADRNALPAAVIISGVLPLLIALLTRRWFGRQ